MSLFMLAVQVFFAITCIVSVEGLCSVGQYVSAGQCLQCDAGTSRPAGDDPLGQDTTCLPSCTTLQPSDTVCKVLVGGLSYTYSAYPPSSGGLTNTFGTIEHITGNLYIAHSQVTFLSFPSLLTIGGNLEIYTSYELVSALFPVLRTIGDYLGVESSKSIVSLSFPELTTVATDIYINAYTVSGPIGGPFTYESALTSMSFPSLVSVGNYLSFDYDLQLTSFTLPSLRSVRYLKLRNLEKLVSASFPNLNYIGEEGFYARYNPVLSRVELGSLMTMVGGFYMADAGQAVTFQLSPCFVNLTKFSGANVAAIELSEGSCSPSSSPSMSGSVTSSISITPSATPSISSSDSISITPSATPSISSSGSISITPSATPSISSSDSISTTPSATSSVSISSSVSNSNSVSSSVTGLSSTSPTPLDDGFSMGTPSKQTNAIVVTVLCILLVLHSLV